jgi:hypothetical protein
MALYLLVRHICIEHYRALVSRSGDFVGVDWGVDVSEE